MIKFSSTAKVGYSHTVIRIQYCTCIWYSYNEHDNSKGGKRLYHWGIFLPLLMLVPGTIQSDRWPRQWHWPAVHTDCVEDLPPGNAPHLSIKADITLALHVWVKVICNFRNADNISIKTLTNNSKKSFYYQYIDKLNNVESKSTKHGSLAHIVELLFEMLQLHSQLE